MTDTVADILADPRFADAVKRIARQPADSVPDGPRPGGFDGDTSWAPPPSDEERRASADRKAVLAALLPEDVGMFETVNGLNAAFLRCRRLLAGMVVSVDAHDEVEVWDVGGAMYQAVNPSRLKGIGPVIIGLRRTLNGHLAAMPTPTPVTDPEPEVAAAVAALDEALDGVLTWMFGFSALTRRCARGLLYRCSASVCLAGGEGRWAPHLLLSAQRAHDAVLPYFKDENDRPWLEVHNIMRNGFFGPHRYGKGT